MKTKDIVENTFTVAENMTDKYWDMWLVGLGSVSWSQEQLDTMIKKYNEQIKIAREENIKVIEELVQQVKKNQMQMQNMIQDAVKAAMENIEVPNFNTLDDLQKKVDELSKKVEQL
ncbi:MAG: phasin family protein [Bacillota bacterium]|jgi:polyhydroxyalkanoate synthesis regulator phasin|nr:phasin family protein [Bacillota bacterium]